MDTHTERLEAAINQQIRVELAERGMDQKTLAEVMGTGRDTLTAISWDTAA